MPTKRTSIHGEWSSRLAFILAATGSAVGLGNIWRFPYIAGENGGGAFVLIYLVCVAVIGVPIMMTEIMLGRRGRRSPINTMLTLAGEEGRSPRWHYVGWAGVVAGFLILSFYSVIGGWTLAYIFRVGAGVFTGATAEGVTSVFDRFVSDPEGLLAWHTVFLTMTMIITARGVRSGLERAVRYLMPALFVLLVIMVGYAMNTAGFGQAFEFLFKPDLGKLKPQGVLAAMGQAFFSLSLGMGAIMVYGSYLQRHASIARTTITIAAADTGVAILAGLAIFPLVFASGLEPEAGSSLIFKTLPLAFGHMPGGRLFGTLFFVLLAFAAWTSAISVIEPMVAWLVENRGHSRVYAAVASGLGAWALGIGTVLSFNLWEDRTLLGQTFFGLLDYLT
ncbi:MAG: sodium-dependent transporter, partial [Gammaproteobacteria bacterium]|nr:sodium-dependent transporter [Gammaproteobacteria bacterium]NIR82976.1 sodium-dependent transporter [Gammaproteobacteria bacterium]